MARSHRISWMLIGVAAMGFGCSVAPPATDTAVAPAGSLAIQQRRGDDDGEGRRRPRPRPTMRPRPTPGPTARPTPRPTWRPSPRPTRRPTPRPIVIIDPYPIPYPVPVTPPPGYEEAIDVATIVVRSGQFAPAWTRVTTGAQVKWLNQDSVSHAISYPIPGQTALGPTWEHVLAPGQSITLVFNTPGTYTYHDRLNPTMQGTIQVQ